MVEKPKIKTLITEAQKGDQDAVVQLVRRFIPVVNKYSRWMGYEEAYADLVVWIVSAVHKYQPLEYAANNNKRRMEEK